jgi:hypothetical protein
MPFVACTRTGGGLGAGGSTGGGPVGTRAAAGIMTGGAEPVGTAALAGAKGLGTIPGAFGGAAAGPAAAA